MRNADLHRFWTVSKPVSVVYAFLRHHVPAQGKLYISMPSQSGLSGRMQASVVYVFPPGVGYLPLCQLVVAVAALRDGGSAVRVDARVQTIIPRPKGEQIPGRVEVLNVTVGSAGKAPLVSRTVTNRTRLHQIAAMIDRLQAEQPETINCPSYSGHPPAVTFTFRAALHGHVLARAREPAYATEPTTPCDPMTVKIKGRQWKPLLGGAAVVHRVQRMLGINLARE